MSGDGPGGPVEAVSLDATGTLIEPREPVGATYAAAARRHGVDLDAERLGEAFRRCLRQARPLAFGPFPDTPCRERRWWHTLVTRTIADVVAAPGEPVADPGGTHAVAGGTAGDRGATLLAGTQKRPSWLDACFEELWEHFASPGAWRPYPEVHGVLDRLRRRGLVLAVVSNFDSRLDAILRGLDLASCFRAVLVSSRAGAAKPDPEIFALAARALGRLPARTVHVGDRAADDVVGARAAGMRAVLLRRQGHEGRGGGEPPDGVPVVGDLTGLEPLLGYPPA